MAKVVEHLCSKCEALSLKKEKEYQFMTLKNSFHMDWNI
jgi:hypothetical protein